VGPVPVPFAVPLLHRFVILNTATIATNLIPFTGLAGGVDARGHGRRAGSVPVSPPDGFPTVTHRSAATSPRSPPSSFMRPARARMSARSSSVMACLP
jgi:hypothetical protein